MPTYSYACTACEHRFEAQQSFTDAALTECPACGGRLRKVYSAVGIVFKGSGFYRTDSRNGARAGAKDGGKDGAKDSRDTAKDSGDTATAKDGSGESSKKGSSAAKDGPGTKGTAPAAGSATSASKPSPTGSAA